VTQTYTTQWFNVAKGDITTHDPQKLVSTSSEIRVLSSEVQWEGINGASQDSITESNTTSGKDAELNGENSLEATFPTLPSGYRFDGHEIILRGKSDFGESDTLDWVLSQTYSDSGTVTVGGGTYSEFYTTTLNSNYVGQTEGFGVTSFSSPDPAYVAMELRTYGVVEKTKDPRVTRDVLGESGGVTLNDGEQSVWFTLDDLEANNEEFYHDIDGSDEARFRFRFDWDYAYPEALRQLRIYDANLDSIHKVALADPSDSLLDYNHVRVSEGDTTYAVDVVDASDPDAISWMKIQTHEGVLSPRAFETVDT
jgi:hypothetical protein